MKQPIDEFLEKQKYSLYTQQAAEKMLKVAIEHIKQYSSCRFCDNLVDRDVALKEINVIASEALE